MPSNIEIKARVADPSRKRALVERLAGTPPTILQQEDTFFPSARGRLKLRQLSPTDGELISYHRADLAGTKQSQYLLSRTAEPAALRAVLADAYGTGTVVTKTRLLYLYGQTRIHLDEVVGLGSFLELEVVLAEGQSPGEGHRIAREIMIALEVRDEDLIGRAYANLLANRSPAAILDAQMPTRTRIGSGVGNRGRSKSMATNTGKGSRKGSVDGRTQVKNTTTGDYVKRNEDPESKNDGKFMGVKKDGKPFKGVAVEPDKRRTKK